MGERTAPRRCRRRNALADQTAGRFSAWDIFREDVIFRRHRGVARKPARGFGPLRGKSVGRGVIDEVGVGPSMRVGESFGGLFDDVDRLQSVGTCLDYLVSVLSQSRSSGDVAVPGNSASRSCAA